MTHYTDSLVRAASIVALFAATLSSSAQNTAEKGTRGQHHGDDGS